MVSPDLSSVGSPGRGWSWCGTCRRRISSAGARPRGMRLSRPVSSRSEEHTSELQSHLNLVCRLLLEKKKKNKTTHNINRITLLEIISKEYQVTVNRL